MGRQRFHNPRQADGRKPPGTNVSSFSKTRSRPETQIEFVVRDHPGPVPGRSGIRVLGESFHHHKVIEIQWTIIGSGRSADPPVGFIAFARSPIWPRPDMLPAWVPSREIPQTLRNCSSATNFLVMGKDDAKRGRTAFHSLHLHHGRRAYPRLSYLLEH